MPPRNKQPAIEQPGWLETQAKVTACRYRPSSMNTLTLGIPTDSNHYIISFSYYAHAKAFNDQFTSPIAIGRGETITICYNPVNPKENDKSTNASVTKGPLFAIGIAGSIILSLLYLAMVRGCN